MEFFYNHNKQVAACAYKLLCVASLKVVRYAAKQCHSFMRKLHNKNSPKNMGGIKPDFTAIPPTETYRCTHQRSSGAA